MSSRHFGSEVSAGAGQPGHSFCADSPHFGKAPWAVPVAPSLAASSSEHDSASTQRL
ncbi:MAG TPA: hypothetical protein PKW35_19585 [Nannocystaceae bacterium]|nr:hypothetical protein [Nannocystaceae bacterium]